MYVPTETLWDLAEREGLRWNFEDLPADLPGYYFDDERLIIVNKSLADNELEFREIFTEELGHAFTTGFNQYSCDATYLSRILDNKVERYALRWAVDFLIDTQEFLCLYSQLSECSHEGLVYQLCQHYGVTPRFIAIKGNRIFNLWGLHSQIPDTNIERRWIL